jgi:hypothetical protein
MSDEVWLCVPIGESIARIMTIDAGAAGLYWSGQSRHPRSRLPSVPVMTATSVVCAVWVTW